MIKQIISQPPGESKYFLLRKTFFTGGICGAKRYTVPFNREILTPV